MNILKKSTLALGLIIGIAGFTGCGTNDNEANNAEGQVQDTKVEETTDTEPIKIGLVGEKHEIWEEVAKRYEEGTGKKIELVKFTDYTQPNEALASGDVDINSFQHHLFLEEFNKERGEELVAIGDTMIQPLGFYSNKIKSLDELEDGARVAIPNDPTNGPRGLFLLQEEGLIKVNGEPGDLITVDDITENPKNLEFIEMDAAQTARSLDDVDIAAVNSNYALDAGLHPSKDSISLEDPHGTDTKIYVNVIATRKEDKDNEDYKELVKYYQTDETKADYEKYTKGAWIPAW